MCSAGIAAGMSERAPSLAATLHKSLPIQVAPPPVQPSLKVQFPLEIQGARQGGRGVSSGVPIQLEGGIGDGPALSCLSRPTDNGQEGASQQQEETEMRQTINNPFQEAATATVMGSSAAVGQQLTRRSP